MSYEINLAEVDTDGAIREAADAVSGDTRLAFLKKAGVAGGALVSGGAVLSALAPAAFGATSVGRPPAKFGKGDIGILNYALTLEYLESEFYNQATAANLPLSPQAAAFLKVVTRDEAAHVAFLKKALGSKAAAKPKFEFGPGNEVTKNAEKFMATSYVLENTGVHAYLGQVTNIKNPAYATAAGTILTIEARHAAVIGLLNEAAGNDIAPEGPFDKPYTAAKVLKAVTETKFIQ
ncbi:MAG: ferritin-like domain-containing protein [Solirubrobacteraceae bacterium]|jgi:hypothetical protein